MQRRDKQSLRSVEEVILRRKMEEQQQQQQSAQQHQQDARAMMSSSLPLIRASAGPGGGMMSAAGVMSKSSSKPGSSAQGRYTEEEVRRMMEEVMKYSRSLQNRVQDLEMQLIHISRNKVMHPDDGPNTKEFADLLAATKTNTVTFAPSVTSNTSSTSNHAQTTKRTTTDNNATTNAFNNRTGSRPATGVTAEMVVDIDNKVSNLKEIFRKNDPLEERKYKAIKIQSLIRGFLARCRYKYFLTAQREWRWIRCRPVIWLLDMLLANQSKLDAGMNLLKMNRVMKTMHVVFGKWAIVCRQNAPLRRSIRQQAEDRIQSKKRSWLKAVFDGFKAVTVGRISKKNANAERRKLVESIRLELSRELIQQGESGIVPESEIKRALHRRVIDEFKVRKRMIVLRGKWNAWNKLVKKAHYNDKQAAKFRFKVLAGKCFYAWSDHTYLKSRGLDRKRWPGPRKYEVRYNQKRVDNFARIRTEKLIFVAWKAYFAVQYKVKRSYQRKVAQFVGIVFKAWKKVTSDHRALRRKVYDNWIEYPKLMVIGPFQAWAEFVRGQKNKFNEHVRIAKAYRRWKSRQKLQMIVKVWRHQALFGRLDGLYTRQMLLKSLGEQKIFSNSLEKIMADQTVELEEYRLVVNSEIDKRRDLESEILKLNNENNKLKMTNHHFEQEINRMESIIHSMAMINPKQMEHLKKLQPDFKFKERSIATKYTDDPPVDLGATGNNNMTAAPAETSSGADTGRQKHDAKLAHDDDGSVESVNNAFDLPLATEDDHSVMAGSETQSLSGMEPQPAATTKVDEDPNSNAVQNPTKIEEVSKTPPSEVVHNGTENVNLAPALSDGDAKLLERTKWLVGRYRHSLQLIAEAMEKKKEEELLEAEARQRDLEEAERLQQQQFDDEDSVGGSVGDNSLPNVNKEVGKSTDSNGAPFAATSRPQSNRGRNNLLRTSNPFLRSASLDLFADSVPGINMSAEDPLQKPSIASKIKAGYRSSFSRQLSMMSTASSVDLNIGPLESSGVPPPEYYNDEELEDTVITWAKMLFTFLEFLDTGDITNLPTEDKRLWATHLYNMAKSHNDIPAEMLDEDNRLLHAPEASDNKLEHAIYSALVTVDERMHGGVSWREALLRLRTMFPGAGNFSGFGLGNDSAQDVALFNRLLKMREDLRKVEEIQTIRFQRNFLESQKVSSPKKKGGALKNYHGLHNSVATTMNRIDSSQSLTYTDDGSSVSTAGTETRPLGTNIYAGNLKKLKYVQARQEEEAKLANKKDDASVEDDV